MRLKTERAPQTQYHANANGMRVCVCKGHPTTHKMLNHGMKNSRRYMVVSREPTTRCNAQTQNVEYNNQQMKANKLRSQTEICNVPVCAKEKEEAAVRHNNKACPRQQQSRAIKETGCPSKSRFSGVCCKRARTAQNA